MTEIPPATADHEQPLFFAGGDNELFGIVTEPQGDSNDIGVVLMTARGTFHRNRLSVRMARRLSARGFRVIRFDFEGVGESAGTAKFELDSPLVDNVTGAIDQLAARGSRRFVLVGSCFGARSALAAADSIPSLEGLVLAVMPFGDPRSLPNPRSRNRLRRTMALTRRALFDPESRRLLSHVVRAAVARRRGGGRSANSGATGSVGPESREIEGWLDRLTEREVAILMLFGAEDHSYRGFQQAIDSWQDSLKERMDRLLEVQVASHHNIHGRAEIEAQDWLLEVVEEWIVDRPFGGPVEPPRQSSTAGPQRSAS